MLVAFATLHRKVDDWPRSMVAGSAANVSMRGGCGLGAGGGGGGCSTFGGGGGAAATFFLHPAVARKSVAANTAALSVLRFICILMSSWPPVKFDPYCRCHSFPFAHTGWRLLPWVVSCRTLVPSASIV